jgi:hypothetical protein
MPPVSATRAHGVPAVALYTQVKPLSYNIVSRLSCRALLLCVAVWAVLLSLLHAIHHSLVHRSSPLHCVWTVSTYTGGLFYRTRPLPCNRTLVHVPPASLTALLLTARIANLHRPSLLFSLFRSLSTPLYSSLAPSTTSSSSSSSSSLSTYQSAHGRFLRRRRATRDCCD